MTSSPSGIDDFVTTVSTYAFLFKTSQGREWWKYIEKCMTSFMDYFRVQTWFYIDTFNLTNNFVNIQLHCTVII